MIIDESAEEQNDVCSYCFVYADKDSKTAFVEPVCTREKYRHKEIGTAMTHGVMLKCKELGIEKCYVNSYDWRKKFYNASGFITENTIGFYHKKIYEEVLIMFESDNLIYVKVDEKYIDEYLIMVNDEEIQKLIFTKRKQYSKEQEIEWIKEKLSNDDPVFTILEKTTKRFVGNIELMNKNDETAELGICLTIEMQDKHYGSEAEKRMIEYAFDELNLKYLTAGVFDYNKRSLHCAQKLGFKEIGREEKSSDFVGDFIEIYLRLESNND